MSRGWIRRRAKADSQLVAVCSDVYGNTGAGCAGSSFGRRILGVWPKLYWKVRYVARTPNLRAVIWVRLSSPALMRNFMVLNGSAKRTATLMLSPSSFLRIVMFVIWNEEKRPFGMFIGAR